MDLVLQIWGGSCYLVNKILFAFGGKSGRRARSYQIAAWSIYIAGVPAWVIILVGHHHWIAASVEAGGLPSMLLGLYHAVKGDRVRHRAIGILVAFLTYASLVFGAACTFMTSGGVFGVTHILEIGVMLGFLLGSYQMAKGSNWGWYFFMLMNVSMATLMFLQMKPILMVQQLLSLAFVVIGFSRSLGKRRTG
ncbi:MAG: hypothetical protein Q7R22_009955 [Verrucomicrobiota bacterium JB025]|nr:hypothetical protein [Verrucomicrobiota bacterium JB025]